MKKIFFIATVLCLIIQVSFAANLSKLVILHTNDTHGFDQRADGINGMATVAAIKEAKFPVVATNVFVEATGKNLVQSHAIITKGNVKVGVIGLTTPETVVSTNPKNVLGLTFLAGQALYKSA